MGYTKRTYQWARNDAVERNYGSTLQPWDNVRNYCKNYCRPVIHSNDEMTWSSIQSNLNHQIKRELEINPALEAKLVARAATGHDLSLIFQYGLGTNLNNNFYLEFNNVCIR